jgi:hypothetical protein
MKAAKTYFSPMGLTYRRMAAIAKKRSKNRLYCYPRPVLIAQNPIDQTPDFV